MIVSSGKSDTTSISSRWRRREISSVAHIVAASTTTESSSASVVHLSSLRALSRKVTGLAAHVTGTIVAKSRSSASATASSRTTTSETTTAATTTASSSLITHLSHSNFFLARLFGVPS
jgi:hypothetical protein